MPPLKLYERGTPNETLFGIIERNVRVPVKLLGDFRAQVASLETGERGIAELIGRYGAAGMKAHFAALLDHGERQTRAAIAKLPPASTTSPTTSTPTASSAGRCPSC